MKYRVLPLTAEQAEMQRRAGDAMYRVTEKVQRTIERYVADQIRRLGGPAPAGPVASIGVTEPGGLGPNELVRYLLLDVNERLLLTISGSIDRRENGRASIHLGVICPCGKCGQLN